MKFSDKEIIHCDNHILLVVKPAAVAVQPDLHEEMRLWVQQKFAKKGRAFLEPIHRLDKPVSGLVLFARTSKALERLNAAFREREIEKTYLARVEGWVEKQEGALIHFLKHGSFRAEVVREGHPEGKRAELSYKVLERNHQGTLLEIALGTGRYHQIRVQFATIGHPIVGDAKYGSKQTRDQIALHHYKMVFNHPVTCERLTFVCEPSHELRVGRSQAPEPLRKQLAD